MKHKLPIDPETEQKKTEQRAARRNKRRHPEMKVTGKSVFELQKIIRKQK